MQNIVATLTGLRRPLIGLALLALPLAACGSPYDHVVATAAIPDDYHQRHPIVLANTPTRLDVFLAGASGRLDDRQTADVRAFAADYKLHGQGGVSALVPVGADERSAQATLQAVRTILARSGVHGSMMVGRYSVVDPTLASPVQLSFNKMHAAVASRCGEWPDDLASGQSLNTWNNKTYYNFGCATQKDFAMQVDDPRDLVRARAEEPSDVQMRTRSIGLIRGTPGVQQGIDPSTQWNTHNTTISSVGSN